MANSERPTGQPNGAVPLPGPFDVEPSVPADVAYPMLMAAIEGLPLGAWDKLMVAAYARTDPKSITWIASMLRRAFDYGLRQGRAEQTDEAPAVMALARALNQVTSERDAALQQVASLELEAREAGR